MMTLPGVPWLCAAAFGVGLACGALPAKWYCDAELATVQREHSETQRQTEAQARSEEQRRQVAIEGIREDGQKRIEQAATDGFAAGVASVSLQQRAGNVAKQSACNPGATARGAPANAPALLLADVLARIDARAGELAAIADARRNAGMTCQNSYNALDDR